MSPEVIRTIKWPGREPGTVKRAWIVYFCHPAYPDKEYRVTWAEGEPEIKDPVKFVLDNISSALIYKVPDAVQQRNESTEVQSEQTS
jgi:hypothetical protein